MNDVKNSHARTHHSTAIRTRRNVLRYFASYRAALRSKMLVVRLSRFIPSTATLSETAIPFVDVYGDAYRRLHSSK